MEAKALISPIVPALSPTDTGQRALNWMEVFRVSHLPLVKDDEYIALISDKDIYDHDLIDSTFEDTVIPTQRPYIKKNQHVMEAAEMLYRLKLTSIPVLDLTNNYLGMITVQDLGHHIAGVLSEQEAGGIIVLEIGQHDYVLSEIARIVEENDAKILSLYLKSQPNSQELDVTLKVNKIDLSPIIQTFVRYDYNIKAVYMDDNILKNMYDDRFDQFMNYLNI
ncbi:CBS domain-containing protein [Puteibacter caeruleilacunae]|nr:CBS domain-containing protein [Puteibacter caeruleilacunae]